jgi:hypothetical protein
VNTVSGAAACSAAGVTADCDSAGCVSAGCDSCDSDPVLFSSPIILTPRARVY